MKTAAEHIYSTITGVPAIVSRLSGGLHWEFCINEDEALPLATFTVIETPPATKNFAGSYEVTISVYDEAINNAVETADIIKTELKEIWKFSSMRTGYTSDEARESFAEIVFTFKL